MTQWYDKNEFRKYKILAPLAEEKFWMRACMHFPQKKIIKVQMHASISSGTPPPQQQLMMFNYIYKGVL